MAFYQREKTLKPVSILGRKYFVGRGADNKLIAATPESKTDIKNNIKNENHDLMRELWEAGENLTTIAALCGTVRGTVLYRARLFKWQRGEKKPKTYKEFVQKSEAVAIKLRKERHKTCKHAEDQIVIICRHCGEHLEATRHSPAKAKVIFL